MPGTRQKSRHDNGSPCAAGKRGSARTSAYLSFWEAVGDDRLRVLCLIFASANAELLKVPE